MPAMQKTGFFFLLQVASIGAVPYRHTFEHRRFLMSKF
jgi:hypothetical protein